MLRREESKGAHDIRDFAQGKHVCGAAWLHAVLALRPYLPVIEVVLNLMKELVASLACSELAQ